MKEYQLPLLTYSLYSSTQGEALEVVPRNSSGPTDM